MSIQRHEETTCNQKAGYTCGYAGSCERWLSQIERVALQVGKLLIAVRDLQASIKRFRAAYGLPAPVEQTDAGFGAQLASFSGTPVVLVHAARQVGAAQHKNREASAPMQKRGR